MKFSCGLFLCGFIVTVCNFPTNCHAGVIDTITLKPGLADGKDNSLSRGGEGTESRANENAGGSDSLTVGMIGNHGQIHRVLMQFDLPSLNPSDSLLSARLGLTVYAAAVSTAPVEIYRMKQSWVEGSQTGPDSNPPDGATWQTFDGTNEWPGISGFRSLDGGGFSLLSAEINDTLGSGTLFNNGEISWIELDVSKVSEWMNGAFENNGLLIRSLNENSGSSSIAFASSEYPDPELHPIFELTIDTSPTVPEPSTFVLLLTGFVGLVGYGWRRKGMTVIRYSKAVIIVLVIWGFQCQTTNAALIRLYGTFAVEDSAHFDGADLDIPGPGTDPISIDGSFTNKYINMWGNEFGFAKAAFQASHDSNEVSISSWVRAEDGPELPYSSNAAVRVSYQFWIDPEPGENIGDMVTLYAHILESPFTPESGSGYFSSIGYWTELYSGSESPFEALFYSYLYKHNETGSFALSIPIGEHLVMSHYHTGSAFNFSGSLENIIAANDLTFQVSFDPTAPPPPPPDFPSEVPEPSTFVLLLTGAIGFVGYHRRRRKQVAA